MTVSKHFRSDSIRSVSPMTADEEFAKSSRENLRITTAAKVSGVVLGNPNDESFALDSPISSGLEPSVKIARGFFLKEHFYERPVSPKEALESSAIPRDVADESNRSSPIDERAKEDPTPNQGTAVDAEKKDFDSSGRRQVVPSTVDLASGKNDVNQHRTPNLWLHRNNRNTAQKRKVALELLHDTKQEQNCGVSEGAVSSELANSVSNEGEGSYFSILPFIWNLTGAFSRAPSDLEEKGVSSMKPLKEAYNEKFDKVSETFETWNWILLEGAKSAIANSLCKDFLKDKWEVINEKGTEFSFDHTEITVSTFEHLKRLLTDDAPKNPFICCAYYMGKIVCISQFDETKVQFYEPKGCNELSVGIEKFEEGWGKGGKTFAANAEGDARFTKQIVLFEMKDPFSSKDAIEQDFQASSIGLKKACIFSHYWTLKNSFVRPFETISCGEKILNTLEDDHLISEIAELESLEALRKVFSEKDLADFSSKEVCLITDVGEVFFVDRVQPEIYIRHLFTGRVFRGSDLFQKNFPKVFKGVVTHSEASSFLTPTTTCLQKAAIGVINMAQGEKKPKQDHHSFFMEIWDKSRLGYQSAVGPFQVDQLQLESLDGLKDALTPNSCILFPSFTKWSAIFGVSRDKQRVLCLAPSKNGDGICLMQKSFDAFSEEVNCSRELIPPEFKSWTRKIYERTSDDRSDASFC